MSLRMYLEELLFLTVWAFVFGDLPVRKKIWFFGSSTCSQSPLIERHIDYLMIYPLFLFHHRGGFLELFQLSIH